MKKTVLSFLAICIAITTIQAQNEPVNPFEEFGYKPKIATLSKGKYVEFYDQDTIVQIGGAVFNTVTMKIMGFVEYDTIRNEYNISPEVISRWLSPDPLTSEFPSWSPYNYVENNPIRLIDPDGRSATDYKDENGNLLLRTDDGSKDVFTVSNDKVEDFKFFGESYKNDGMKPLYNRKDWNDNMKADILGFETLGDMENTLGAFTTQWSRQNAINYLQDPSIINALAMSFSEALSQWTDPQKLIMAATIYVGGVSVRGTNVYTHNYKYAPRVRARGVQDPVSHNFPYSFDDAILNTKAIPKKNGYNMYQLNGTMNGKDGVFEIGLSKDGIIDHRFFRPTPTK